MNIKPLTTVHSRARTYQELIAAVEATGRIVTPPALKVFEKPSVMPTGNYRYPLYMVLGAKNFTEARDFAFANNLMSGTREVGLLLAEAFSQEKLRELGLSMIISSHKPVEIEFFTKEACLLIGEDGDKPILGVWNIATDHTVFGQFNESTAVVFVA